MNIKDIVKDNTVRFDRYRHGIMYYKITVWEQYDPAVKDTKIPATYSFPVPLDDIGDATLHSDDKAIMFMRYIRKALDDGTFVRA